MNTYHKTDHEHVELKKKLGTLEMFVFVICLLIAGLMSTEETDARTSPRTLEPIELLSGE